VQTRLENLASGVNVIPNRGHARSQDFGHLLRGESLDLPENEGRALARAQPLRELPEYPAHFPSLTWEQGRDGARYAFPVWLRDDSRLVTALPSTAKIDGQVGGDPADPGGERAPLTEATQALPSPDERHLRDILGLLLVPNDLVRNTEYLFPMHLDQDFESPHSPGLAFADELRLIHSDALRVAAGPAGLQASCVVTIHIFNDLAPHPV
jgi:hypothetical protein